MRNAGGEWRALQAAGYLALLSLVALTLAVEGSQPVHVHDSGTAALFNGECQLAILAAFRGAPTLPQSSPTTWVTFAGDVRAVAACPRFSALPVQHTDTRAPPA